MGKYFGTDGFRGEANENLTAEHAFAVGRFLGWYYHEKKKNEGNAEKARIVIGVLAAGGILSGAGADCTFLDWNNGGTDWLHTALTSRPDGAWTTATWRCPSRPCPAAGRSR